MHAAAWSGQALHDLNRANTVTLNSPGWAALHDLSCAKTVTLSSPGWADLHDLSREASTQRATQQVVHNAEVGMRSFAGARRP